MSFIIKMDSIKSSDHLTRAIIYIVNPEKTGGLVHGNSGSTAQQMISTFQLTKRLHPTRGNREGYHFKISFSKDESISPENALEFVWEWSEGYLQGKYDYVCSVHQDRDHLHMHLVFNSVSREGGKYRYEKGDWERIIKPLSNRLAEKYHTGPLKEKDLKLDYSSDIDKKFGSTAEGKSKVEGDEALEHIANESASSGLFWKEVVQSDIDHCIGKSHSYADFKARMVSEFHYQLREGVSKKNGIYLALTPPGRAKAIRTYRLDKRYSPSEIEARIEKRLHLCKENIMRPQDDRRMSKKMNKLQESGVIEKAGDRVELEATTEITPKEEMSGGSSWTDAGKLSEGHSRADEGQDWVIVKNCAFIPYGELSEYQRSMVQKVMDAKRLYQRTGTPLYLHEQSVHAIILLVRETSKLGVYRKIRPGWFYVGYRILKNINQVSQSIKIVDGGEKHGRGI